MQSHTTKQFHVNLQVKAVPRYQVVRYKFAIPSLLLAHIKPFLQRQLPLQISTALLVDSRDGAEDGNKHELQYRGSILLYDYLRCMAVH